ncbi:MAG: hypothetical protein JKX78_12750 [Alteromonadaceae bacterium]|nr:hypothetical protein [Alteromonadaceae bacterium]
MKLSRTGWNNVIILSVMLIIIFLNVTNNKLFHRNDEGAYIQDIFLFKDHGVILTLSLNNVMIITRQGKRWSITPKNINISTQALEQMMQSWQQATGIVETLDYDLTKQAAIIINATLADDNHTYQLALYPTQDQLLIYNQQTKQWLSLAPAMYYQLLPREIMQRLLSPRK